ncbi:MAG: amidophosphoribosyltransferase [Bacteroidales bacterium]|nr:amidophosphoribosyltransferase [Bacteroidales bacterium]
MRKMIDTGDRSLHEECGVLAVYGVPEAAQLAYYGLHSLQHRGQQGCGIVTADSSGEMHLHKGRGLVSEVFDGASLAALPGSMAIGHVRYPTTQVGGPENIQPFVFKHSAGNFALAHNGNIINSEELRTSLERHGSLFQTTSDSELFAHLIKKDRSEDHRIYNIMEALNMVEGAFSMVIMTAGRIYACRDKYGFHPLSIGRLGGGYAVASETCAFDAIGAEFLRDVEPGEVVTIDSRGLRSMHYSAFKRHDMCVMEYIYFARPDSDIEGCNVHVFRKKTGKLLYQEHPVEADMVVGVPDSSLSAAMGYAEAAGLPYEMGLLKSKYVGRTFIQPTQTLRDKGVRMKLSPVRSVVSGKRIILIDDSIVRGTTSRRIVAMLREAGATEVHVCIASPKYAFPCYYGVDTGTYDELIGAGHSVEQIRAFIGADSLYFLSKEALFSASGRSELCTACFTGCYPTDLYAYRRDRDQFAGPGEPEEPTDPSQI